MARGLCASHATFGPTPNGLSLGTDAPFARPMRYSSPRYAALKAGPTTQAYSHKYALASLVGRPALVAQHIFPCNLVLANPFAPQLSVAPALHFGTV
ncbi:hypothetical protein FF2_024752 [Malus domestica]